MAIELCITLNIAPYNVFTKYIYYLYVFIKHVDDVYFMFLYAMGDIWISLQMQDKFLW